MNGTKIEVPADELQPKEEETIVEEKRSKGARIMLFVAGTVVAVAAIVLLVFAILKLYYLFL